MSSGNDELQRYIGRIIKDHRDKKAWSREKLEEKTNLDATNIGRLERGEQLPEFQTFVLLADTLNINVDVHIKEIAEIIRSNKA